MGLAYRVIPTVLCKGRQQVKGQKFNPWRTVGIAAQAVRVHQGRNVDELVLLDVGATPEGRGPDLSLVEELADVCFMPLSVGGGVRSVQDVRDLLNAGADKVVIGTEGLVNPWLIPAVVDVVGSQAVVAALDERWRYAITHCGQRSYGIKAVHVAKELARRGAGEILLTAIEREGTQEGYDLALIEEISREVSVPVIAHGGCAGYEDMANAIRAGASAVAVGALFQFTSATPKEAAQYLAAQGIEARV